jgi:hypothetical protein
MQRHFGLSVTMLLLLGLATFFFGGRLDRLVANDQKMQELCAYYQRALQEKKLVRAHAALSEVVLVEDAVGTSYCRNSLMEAHVAALGQVGSLDKLRLEQVCEYFELQALGLTHQQIIGTTTPVSWDGK